MRWVYTWLRGRQRVIISVDVNYISVTRDTGFTVSWNIVTMDSRDIMGRGCPWNVGPKLSAPVFGPVRIFMASESVPNFVNVL